MVIETARAEIEARARVTERMRPLRIEGQLVHQVALPWHWGFGGASPGDSANDLGALASRPERLDPGGQGVHLRRPRRPPHGRDDRAARGRARAEAAPSPTSDAPSEDTATS